MPYTLSLNTNPLVNRFAEPADLIDTVVRGAGIRRLQLTHEFINPAWPSSVVRRLTRTTSRSLARTGMKIESGMIGPTGRLNQFGHPDRDVRQYHVNWFKTFVDIIADLGGTAVGSPFAILTYSDYDAPGRREELVEIAIDCWAEVAEHGQAAGLRHLFWEPMSVGREFGHTIEACLGLQYRLDAARMAIPMRVMADVDHGDLTSSNPDDTDPYAWARAVAKVSPIIHIKQSMPDKSSHRPFTAANNANGRINPESLLRALADGGGTDNDLCLELSFREREPSDRAVIAEIAESVAYWMPYVTADARVLDA